MSANPQHLLTVDMENDRPFKLDPTVIDDILNRLEQEKTFLRTIPILQLKAHLRNIKVAVIGPSGGGKSTLIEALTGLPNSSKSDCLPGRFEGPEKTKDFSGKGWRISDSQGFENWGAEDFTFLNEILHPKDIHETPAVVIYCHRASQRLTGFNDVAPSASGERAKALELSRVQNEAKFLKAISESHSSLLYVVTDIYSVGDKLQNVIKSTNAMAERLWDSKAIRVESDEAHPTLVWQIAGTATTICYVNTVEKVTRDLITSQTFTNGPVGIDDLRERLCFQAPLRAAKNLIAAIDSRPWWDILLFSGGLHALLVAASTCTPQSRWDVIIKSLLKDPKVAELYLAAASADRWSFVDALVRAYQLGHVSTASIRSSIARMVSPESSSEVRPLLNTIANSGGSAPVLQAAS